MLAEVETELQSTEARHRLANCLQIANILIQFRLSRTSGQEVRCHLPWLRETVTSLGLLPQRLTRAETAQFQDYLAESTRMWRAVTRERSIRILLVCDAVDVSREQTMPLALIVHELLANCCKHAFPDERGGTIHISFRELPGRVAELLVADEGAGLTRSPAVEAGTGLDMVSQLACQLGGSFALEPGTPGSIARLSFPLRG